ncbi:MAG: preprotein translocase subunit SecE [Candidatus Sumerlaeaceae bacterium]|nr:preprotein translocase subunit SecE [Candidatus Sumerlaeaceae bacterium]
MEQSTTTKRGKLRTFYDEVVAELKKVTWPSKRELYGATAVVITVIILLSVAVGIVDALLGKIMEKLIILGLGS